MSLYMFLFKIVKDLHTSHDCPLFPPHTVLWVALQSAGPHSCHWHTLRLFSSTWRQEHMYWLISPYTQTGPTRPFFSQLTAQCIFLSVAFQESFLGSRWRAAVLTKVNRYSLRHWRDPQASAGVLPLSQWKGTFITFFSTGKRLDAAYEIHSERALDGLEKTQVRALSIMLKLFLMGAVLGVMPCSC